MIFSSPRYFIESCPGLGPGALLTLVRIPDLVFIPADGELVIVLNRVKVKVRYKISDRI